MLLVGRSVPTKVIRVRNKDKSWFDDQCRHAFGLKQEARLTRDRSRLNREGFVRCQVRLSCFPACLGSFPACWRQGTATRIPKGPPSFSVANYRPISITSILSRVFWRLMSVRLLRFRDCSALCASNHTVCLSERSGYL